MGEPTEAIHDREIHPLMEKIIALCKAHKIGFAGALSMIDEDGGVVVSRTILAGPDYPQDEGMKAVERAVVGMVRTPLMLTVRGPDGEIKSMEAIL